MRGSEPQVTLAHSHATQCAYLNPMIWLGYQEHVLLFPSSRHSPPLASYFTQDPVIGPTGGSRYHLPSLVAYTNHRDIPLPAVPKNMRL